MGHVKTGVDGWRGKPLVASREDIRRRVCGDVMPEGAVFPTKVKTKPATARKRSK